MSGTTSANGFQRRTIQELITQAQTDIEANLPGAFARLPQSNLDALSCMSAGMADEQLESIDYYAKQIHVTTATGVWLSRHGSEWGVFRKEATRATGTLRIAVAANTTVPAGSLFQTAARIRVRTTAVGSSVPAGTVDIATEAIETGPSGNLATGTELDTVNPVAGVTGAVVAIPGFAGGNPREGIEAYRGRILSRIQKPPQGGAQHDYEAWMLAYPGCTRAWCSPREQGSGTVVNRFAMDGTYQGGIPTAAEVARMTQWLDERRPVTAEVFVYAPTPRAIDVTVRDLVPNTPAVQQAVLDELNDMLLREGAPGEVMHRSWFWEAVSVAAGERSHTIDAPATDVQLLGGELPVLGTLDFVQTP
ncbi:MAG TPA: baseplate J/gp47 family protein [Acetobacteraceae bacterium]|jgi:uncharacterized phage protein gp47/JayE|nr:baseplate J/gp47 family protein [Acetobacteraceae bacterium]